MTSGFAGQLLAAVRRSRKTAAGIALTLAALSAVTACSLLLNSDTEQCSTDQDCRARGSLFAASVCTPQNTCYVPPVVLDGKCKTNKECIDLNGGQPAMCRKSDHSCQPLKKGKCDHVFAAPSELESDDAVYLGLTGPVFTGANASDPLWREIYGGVNLAQYELFQSGGIPSSEAGHRNRPLVFVGCDELGAPGDHQATLDHLQKDLEVPAMIGPELSTNFIKDLGVLIPSGMMLMSVVASAANLPALDKKGLGYSTSPPDTISARAIAAYIQKYVEPGLHSSGVVPAGQPVKLLVLEIGNALGTSLLTEFKSNLVLNGKTPDQNGADGNYKEINYGDAFDTANNPNPEQKYAQATLDMIAFQPHIVYVAGASEAVANIMAKAEPSWTAAYRPFYLGISQMATGGALAKLMGTDPDFRKRVRVFDVGFGTPQPPYADFAARYDQRNDKSNPEYGPPLRYAAQAYDAAYLYMYAIAAAKGPLTGASIAEGLKKTQPASGGIAVEVGPSALPQQLQSLSSGGAIDLNGASGKLDFGPTGHVDADSLVQCAQVGPADGGAGGDAGGLPVVGFAVSGLYYGLESKTFGGTESCP